MNSDSFFHRLKTQQHEILSFVGRAKQLTGFVEENRLKELEPQCPIGQQAYERSRAHGRSGGGEYRQLDLLLATHKDTSFYSEWCLQILVESN